MNKNFKLAMIGGWIMLGSIPMVYLWKYLDAILRAILGVVDIRENSIAEGISMLACIYGFMFVVYIISEIKTDTKQDKL